MKKHTMIDLMAVAGLVLGTTSVMASDFGGGWVQNKDTGTIYYSLAPIPERNHSASHGMKSESRNEFGGGWVQNKDTGTLFYSLAPTPERNHSASHGEKSETRNEFGAGWVQNKDTGTLYYSHAHGNSHDQKSVENHTYSYVNNQENNHEQL